MDAIILAGGKGTRLGELTRLTPKPMVPIAGRPFLEYLMTVAAGQGVSRFILSVGHLGVQISDHFGSDWLGVPVEYAHETSPLGTGGAIALAARRVRSETCLILNGDTFFDVDIGRLLDFHQRHNAELTLALKRLGHFDRYGTVLLDGPRVIGFAEKQPTAEGVINGGIYLASRSLLEGLPADQVFSFETDLMAKQSGTLGMYGFESDGYFIDIGIPEDYRRADQELPTLIGIPAGASD